MLKIAFFNPALERGGVERTLTRVLNAFAESGHQVDLVYRVAEPAVLDGISSKARLVALPKTASPVLRFLPPRIQTSLQAFPGLVRYLSRERPDVLLSFQSSSLAVWARKLAGGDTRLIVRESNVPSKAAAHDRRLSAKLTLPLKKWSYPHADAIIANSQAGAKDLARLLRLPQQRVHFIHNPTLHDEIFERAEEPLDDPWFQEGEPPVVLAAGRLAHQKDFHTLIRAFAAVRKEIVARLVILGEGEDRESLEQLAAQLGVAPDVQLPGFVSNPYKYMARASVFVLSSRYEGLANVLIEALGLGTPVISTDCPGGSADLLMDGKAGPLVPIGDSHALADAILSILKNPQLAASYVLEGQTSLERFRPEVSIHKYMEMVESLVNPHGSLPARSGASQWRN
jgi:glycosyltransferase involved in cell wall biosynthesis